MNILQLLVLLIVLIPFDSLSREVIEIKAEQLHFWNHATSLSDKYSELLKKANDYDPKITAMGGDLQIDTVLIKKISNWNQQHSNGLKILFNQPELTFGQLEKLSFNLLMDSGASFIPQKEELYQRYKSQIEVGLINKKWIDELCSEFGYLNITLFGEDHENQAIETVIGNYQLKINISMVNQSSLIQLPLHSIDFYRQINWQEQSVPLKNIGNTKILGVLITAETSNQKTLRSYLQENFDETIPETFIELAININGFKVHLSK
ncbi:MAG: hypothetical protein KC469_10140 [Flavobacteriaceae bacterium]|nr:hypothetical protein [Flavobacteriaceae bacterium]